MFATQTFSLNDPQVSSRGAKSCSLTGETGKVIFQLGEELEPCSTPFGAGSFGDEAATRQTLEFRLTPKQDEEWLAFDVWAIDYLWEHSERIFKKSMTRAQIEDHYRSPCTRKEGYQPLLRTKINTAGRNSVRVWDESNERRSLPEDLRLFEMVPMIHLSHLWIMGRDFGFVLNCTDIKCLNGSSECKCPFAD